MTLFELQQKLGEQINILTGELTQEQLNDQLKVAQTISSLAKQMINNADIVLRQNVFLSKNSETLLIGGEILEADEKEER